MPTRFMTDPDQMRAMAGRFDVHAQTVEDEARKMWASSVNIAGASWSGTAQATSYDTMSPRREQLRAARAGVPEHPAQLASTAAAA
ncbi:WXG100 family type VII secretion target [Mycobacterium noviomagense]|uniref:WXG100 family type VII secretion target n=1 Tax=Mycobacterium noviomagense TaxID=459858 RepID=UPI003556DB3A